MDRLQVRWTGFMGGPGYSNFYFVGGVAHSDPVHAFFTSLSALMVGNCSVNIPDGGDTFNEATGELTGAWGTPTSRNVASQNGPAAYAGGSGACISWNTNSINRGRKIRGRTFLVPLYGGTFDTDGSISAMHLTELNNWVATFADAGASGLGIWSRPRLGIGGLHGPVTGGVVHDLAAVLRSRRD